MPHNICSNGTVTAPTRTQHITKVAESGFLIKHGAVKFHFSHSSAIDGPSLAFTPGADIDLVGSQSLSDATALLVGPQHTLWTLYGVVDDTTTVDSTGAFAKFLEDILARTRDQEPRLFHADEEPFTFHASLPRIELGDTFLLGWPVTCARLWALEYMSWMTHSPFLDPEALQSPP